MNREEWLTLASDKLADLTCIRRTELPRVSCGWPSTAALSRSRRRLGECWLSKATADQRAQVFITPLLADSEEVLAVLVHELGHAKHQDGKHGAIFKRYMHLVDLQGPAKSTHAGPQLTLHLASLARELGPYPHSEIQPAVKDKVQGTRMLKAECDGCGCVVRLTAKWAGEGGQTAPFCGYCGIDGNPDTLVRMRLDGAAPK